jgi:LCP family protein required for cell wall assembly
VTTERGPRGPRPPRRGPRLISVLGIVALAAALAVATTGLLLYQQAEGALTRVSMDALNDPDETHETDETDAETADSDARHFLVVGSDSRADVEHDDVATGDKEGQRSDVIMYVSLTDDRRGISLVSLPRDLLVERDGHEQRISDTFESGAGNLVRTLQEEYGLPVHHYAEVSFDGFIDAVDTIGGVDMCLEDDLVDPDAGADLEAGCQRLAPADALAFVRSRQGDRADYERIERQQRFLRAAVDELTQRRILSNVPRLFDLVEDVAGNVTTDDGLTIPKMLGLADDVRKVLDDDVPMSAVPAYPDTLGEAKVMRIYEPGARAMFDALREGRQITDRGTQEERAETVVAVWSGGREEGLEIIGSVLLFGGFENRLAAGPGPAEYDAGSTTTVYAHAEDKAAAERVAALLGAPIRELPGDVEAPEGADVVVAVGSDAAASATAADTLGDSAGQIETQGPQRDG